MKINTLGTSPDGSDLLIQTSDFVPDTPTKATNLGAFIIPENQPQAANYVETVEASAERVTGGNVRLMVKSVLRLPRVDPLATAQGGLTVFGSGQDIMTLHVVVSIPKPIADSMLSAAQGLIPMQKAYIELIARQVCSVVGVLGGADVTVIPAPTPETLLTNMFGSTAPLRRALVGLQPLDTTNGLYGGATLP